MRWGVKEPKENAIRYRRKFLWLPMCIYGEWRWLEWATVKERYQVISDDWARGWCPLEWVDDEPQ